MESIDERGPDRMRLDIEVRTLLLLVGVVTAAWLLAVLVGEANRPIGWGVACALVAALVTPVVSRLDRHLPHALAVLLVLVVLAATLIGAWVGIASTIISNVDRIVDEAPVAAAQIEENSELARDFGLADRVQSFADEIDTRFGFSAQVGQTPSTASTYIVTGILMLFFVVYGPRLAGSAIEQIPGDERRERIRGVLQEAYPRWTRYVWAAVAQSVVLTLIAWPLLYSLDLPGSFVLALLLGLLSVFPYVGIPLAGVGILLFAAATTDARTIGTVVAFVIIASLLEVFVVRPRVDDSTIYVGPAVPVIIALLGWELYGFGGALYGVMLATLGLAVVIASQTPDRALDHAPTDDKG